MASTPPTSSHHPDTWKFDYPIYHAQTRKQLRAWFAANHDNAPGLWLCSWRAVARGPRCPYPEVVEEALCFGWIDSTTTILDDDRGLQLLTPRKAKSSWTRLNRSRVADMERAGLMTNAGRSAVTVAKSNGWWTIYEQVEDLVEPETLTKALNANDEARAAWDGFPPSARKMMLWWVISAARPDTQERRISEIVAKAAVGERARP
jgi:uncharacterized protein YdeI (YjbR/CyaY-like superfamily)